MTRIIGYARSGELSQDNGTQKKLLEQAGECLDHACSHEIIGDVVFLAEDGWKVASTEVVISHAAPSYLKDLLQELLDEGEETDLSTEQIEQGIEEADQMIDLADQYTTYRLLWSTNMRPSYVVKQSPCVSDLLEARELLAQHELKLGNLVDCNTWFIEGWSQDEQQWEGLEDEEIELFRRFGL